MLSRKLGRIAKNIGLGKREAKSKSREGDRGLVSGYNSYDDLIDDLRKGVTDPLINLITFLLKNKGKFLTTADVQKIEKKMDRVVYDVLEEFGVYDE